MVNYPGPFLPSPPPMPEVMVRTSAAGQPVCRAMRGVGWEGELECDLIEGHPGNWHYEPGIWWEQYRPSEFSSLTDD